ncbi:MAG TPA: ABC transporter permease [Burkholderiales bacterium]|nr:ABC transporter permease [Burkholderiales bacterium]
MIELRDVHKTYHMGDTVVRALRGVSLNVEPGEFLAITGPSGSGKSTLMHVIGLLDVPDSGSYRLYEREISKLSDDQLAVLRRQEVGFVFQQFHLLARTSAAENVSLPLLYSHGRYDLDVARELLRQVGLADRTEHRPNELSGGQQQRVAIARSLVNHPRILLADEPTGNLDSKSQQEILDLLRELNSQGITVIIVTHEEEVAREATRRIRMRDGEIQADERPRAKSKPTASAPLPTGTGASAWHWREAAEHVRQGLRSLAASKGRTALSMLGILIGVAAVVAMLAFGRGAQDEIKRQLAFLGTNMINLSPGVLRAGGVTQVAGTTRIRLRPDDAAAIKENVRGVKEVAPIVSGRARVTFGNKNWDTSLYGTTSANARMHASVPLIGRYLTEEENQRRALVVVIGPTVAQELFAGQNPIGQFMKINRVNAQVIGVLPEKGASGFRDLDDIVIAPINTAMRRLLGKEFVDWLDIEAESPEMVEPVKEAVNDFMLSRHRVPPSQSTDAFRLRSMNEIQQAAEASTRTMTLLLSSIAAISLLVGGIGIMNIMLVSVTERTREIGLRKAVGARSRDIQAQFLIETVVISVAGGIAGILFGWGATKVLAFFTEWKTVVTLGVVALAFSFSATIGLIFGIYPARRAAALNPIEALRYE